MLLIHKPTRSTRNGWTTAAWPIAGSGKLAGRTLSFSVPEEHADMLSGRSDAAMVALLIPCMELAEDLRVEGAVSPRLLARLNGPIQRMLLGVMPHLRPIRVHAEETCADPERPPAARLCGFSGGGDSLYTLLSPRAPGDAAPTHLVNFNVGGHGEGDAADAVFRERVERLGRGAALLGLPLVPADSNLRRFFNSRTHFLATVVVRNAAAALALQGGAAAYDFSNAYNVSRQGILQLGDISRIEDALMPLFSTENLSIRVIGSDQTRVGKLMLVTAQPASEQILDVCQRPRRARRRPNCSRCMKCQRALIFLEITGRIDRFDQVFDLRLHRRLRWWAHACFLHGIPDMRREFETLAAERGFRFSRLGRLCAKPVFFHAGKLLQRILARLP